MNDNVVDFGKPRPSENDTPQERSDKIAEMFADAAKEQWQDVLVCGVNAEGVRVFLTSYGKPQNVLWQLERAKFDLMHFHHAVED